VEKMLRACLNWRVLGALALVGLGLWAFAPNLLTGALPILALAACPLSMLLMMKGMQGDRQRDSGALTHKLEVSGDSEQERLAELKDELEQTRLQEQEIRRKISRLEGTFDDEPLQAP